MHMERSTERSGCMVKRKLALSPGEEEGKEEGAWETTARLIMTSLTRGYPIWISNYARAKFENVSSLFKV